jgi:hypothetical protein
MLFHAPDRRNRLPCGTAPDLWLNGWVEPPPTEVPAVVRTRAALLRRRVSVTPLWLPVRGPSMDPTVRDGWEVRVVPGSRPRRGELWAFYNPDGVLVVHRCRRSNDGVHLFAGDALVRADPLVRDELLVGRVTGLRGEGPTRVVTRRDRATWWVTNARRAIGLRARVFRRAES